MTDAVATIEWVFLPIMIFTFIILSITCIIFGRMCYYFIFHDKYKKTHTLIRRITILMILSYIFSNILDIIIFYIAFNDELNNVQQYGFGTNLIVTILNLRTFDYVETDGLILNILTSIFTVIAQCSLYLVLIGRLYLTFQDTIHRAPYWLFCLYGIAMFCIFVCWIISFIYIVFFGRSNPITDLETLMISVSFISFIDFFMGISLIYLFAKKLYILILTRKKTSVLYTNTPQNTQKCTQNIVSITKSKSTTKYILVNNNPFSKPLLDYNEYRQSLTISPIPISPSTDIEMNQIIDTNDNNDNDEVITPLPTDLTIDNEKQIEHKQKYFGHYNIYSDSPLIIMMIKHTLLGTLLIGMTQIDYWSHALIFGGIYNNQNNNNWYIGWIFLIYWSGFTQIFVILCVYLGFGFANNLYKKICKYCDLCCRDVCECITSSMMKKYKNPSFQSY